MKQYAVHVTCTAGGRRRGRVTGAGRAVLRSRPRGRSPTAIGSRLPRLAPCLQIPVLNEH